MKVKLIKDCKMAPEGHTTFDYKKDQIVEGQAAEIALKYKYGKKFKETPAPTVIKPDEGPNEEG